MHPKMVDQLQCAGIIDPRIQRKLGIGWPGEGTSAPPELLQTPPRTDAPMQDEPITECVCG